jgi:hypothetical protein
MTTKQFVIRFFSVTFLLLALVGLFNRIVDPFWYYRDTGIKGFNTIKPKFGRYERHIKPVLLMRDQPDAIILGSSYSEIGFNPFNPFFTDYGRLKGMNFAFAGAPWSMVQCEFEFGVTHSKIKRAVIGFHPGSLPLVDCTKDFASLGQISPGELLFSSLSLGASFETILEQNENPTHTREGMFFSERGRTGVDNRFRLLFSRIVNKNSQCLNPIKPDDLSIHSISASTHDLSGLERMIKTAKVHGVELVLFAYPQHAYGLELDNRCGGQIEYWRAMKQIAGLIESEAKPDQVRAWQFYGYNDITSEPIGTRAKYWQDPWHFNFEVGDMILADMFGKNPEGPKLGRPISTKSIETDFQDYLLGRSEYLRLHPEFQTDLNKLEQLCSDPRNKC